MLKKTNWQNSPKRWGVTIIIFYFSKKCLCFLHHWSEWNNEIHCGERLSLKQQKGSSQEIHWKAFDRAFFWHILINISNWCIFPLQIFFFFPFFFSFLIPVNMVELCGKVMVAGKNDFLHSTKTKFTTTIGFSPPLGWLDMHFIY